MGEFIKKNTKIVGAAPGTLVHIGQKYHEDSFYNYIEYGEDFFNEEDSSDVNTCFKKEREDTCKWINVNGLSGIEGIEKIGKEFSLHSLLLEDILNTGGRAKLDDYDDCVFLILKMVYNDSNNETKSEQISLVLKEKNVITFQEFKGEIFLNVVDRLKAGRRNIRRTGSNYLLYALIDAVVDSYFSVIENLSDKIDLLEDKLMVNPGREVLNEIYKLKKEILFIRNSIWPVREALSSLVRSESDVLGENIVLYLRDVYDHSIQVIDTLETYQDIMSNMLDTYLSSISNKTNDIMKVLTIFSTTFIPLTFLAGIYGMNFNNIPELSWKYGYLGFWIFSLIIIIAMLSYFKRKKWF